jgi:hypothetical protein
MRSTVHTLGAAAKKANAERFAANIIPIIREIQASGITTLRGVARAVGRGRMHDTVRDCHQAIDHGYAVRHTWRDQPRRDVRVILPGRAVRFWRHRTL